MDLNQCYGTKHRDAGLIPDTQKSIPIILLDIMFNNMEYINMPFVTIPSCEFDHHMNTSLNSSMNLQFQWTISEFTPASSSKRG